jgi:ABC-2 type transport system permease protein
MTTPSATNAATNAAANTGMPAAPVRPQAATAQPRGGYDFTLLGSLWTLFTLTLRQHVRGKRWIIMGLLFLLPAGLAILIRATTPEPRTDIPEFLLAWMFIPQMLLPLTALVYSSGILQDEQEEQTITYLLMRPTPKWTIYLVKLAATLVTTSVLVALFTAITYAAIFVGAESSVAEVAKTSDEFGQSYKPIARLPDAATILDRCLTTIGIHTLAVVAYCSLFGFLSIITRRTLVIGILYIAVVEGILANMPFGIRLGTVIYYTRLIAFRTMDFIIQHRGGRTDNMAAEAWQFDLRKDPQLLEHPEFATCLRVLVIASIACAILAAWQCSRREFHVKTPEKD